MFLNCVIFNAAEKLLFITSVAHVFYVMTEKIAIIVKIFTNTEMFDVFWF